MARKHYGKQFGKIFAALVLLIVTVIGLSYGSLLRAMDRAADDFSRGDPEAALKGYEGIDQRLQSLGALRVIPVEDRRALILNEARLLYALGRFDDAQERLNRELEIAGSTDNDARFLLLKGDLAFRKAFDNYNTSPERDTRLLDDALHGAEDNLRDSLRLSPSDWDAKYNFEYVNYTRNLINASPNAKIRLLTGKPGNEQKEPLPPDQQR